MTKNLIIKYVLISLLFLIFSLLQSVFLPFFNIFGQIPNLVFVLFYLLIFFEERGDGFTWSIIAGFFLDVFMTSHFGISIICLLVVYFDQKLLRYFLKEMHGKYLIFNFLAMFSANFIFYNVLVYIASIIFDFQFTVGFGLIVSLLYSIVFLLPAFYIFKIIARPDYLENQLKLI